MAQIEKFKKIGAGLSLDPVLKKAERGATNQARLAHVNEVIDFIRNAATIAHATNADAKTAGLVDGDLYHTAGVLKIVYTP